MFETLESRCLMSATTITSTPSQPASSPNEMTAAEQAQLMSTVMEAISTTIKSMNSQLQNIAKTSG